MIGKITADYILDDQGKVILSRPTFTGKHVNFLNASESMSNLKKIGDYLIDFDGDFHYVNETNINITDSLFSYVSFDLNLVLELLESKDSVHQDEIEELLNREHKEYLVSLGLKDPSIKLQFSTYPSKLHAFVYAKNILYLDDFESMIGEDCNKIIIIDVDEEKVLVYISHNTDTVYFKPLEKALSSKTLKV